MVTINGLTKEKSIWKPQFMEEINQDVCLNCDRFDEVGGLKALRLRPINKDNNYAAHQVLTIANPKQCVDCEVCTSIYKKKY